MESNAGEELARLRLRTQADIQRMWELLMGPLGFSRTSLWVTFVGRDDEPILQIVRIDEMEGQEPPSPEQADQLFAMLSQVALETGDIAGFVFLLSRPGRGGLLPADRVIAKWLLDGSQRAGIRSHPVHVANDVAILAIAPDDLAA